MSEFPVHQVKLDPCEPVSVRKQALLEKMALDRLRLATAARAGAPSRRPAAHGSPGPATTGPRREPESFLVEHAPAIAASLLGLVVLGPRKALMSAVRTAAPALLVRGGLALLGRIGR